MRISSVLTLVLLVIFQELSNTGFLFLVLLSESSAHMHGYRKVDKGSVRIILVL